MISEKIDFYGKEVADAIKKACEELHLPQEALDIEVVDTGSTGIFGLIRKKAHIKVQVKAVRPQTAEENHAEVVLPLPEEEVRADIIPVDDMENGDGAEEGDELLDEEESIEILEDDEDNDDESLDDSVEELAAESLQIIKEDLQQLLQLMGYPSTVELSARGASVTCRVGAEFEEALTGQDGKTLDSIQYLLRKIIARKIPHRLRLVVDIGNYREKRLVDLKNRAIELVAMVKSDGKTQVIPALSPSERRVVHMALQDDKEIRSRSVGDGLFKKILIYKPGKGGRPEKNGGRKRNSSRGRKGGNYRKKSE